MHSAFRFLSVLAGVTVLIVMPLEPAAAQTSKAIGAAGTSVTPPATTAQVPNQPKVGFCREKEIGGLWRLLRVFEIPKAELSKDLERFPIQYVRFDIKNSVMDEIKSSQPIKDVQTIKKMLTDTSAANMQQFVLNKSGVLFVYKKRVFSNSYYCGIVKNKAGIYRKGDMVLTPTAVDKKGVFELYGRVWQPPAKKKPKAAAKKKSKASKKKKR